MASKYLDKALAQVNPENRVFVKKNLDITEEVMAILSRKNMTQRDLALALGKSEPEISRMLSGLHNLTLKTIAKLEVALGEDIILTPGRMEEVLDKFKPAKVVSLTSVFGSGSRNEHDYLVPASEGKGAMEAYIRELGISRKSVTTVHIEREPKLAI